MQSSKNFVRSVTSSLKIISTKFLKYSYESKYSDKMILNIKKKDNQNEKEKIPEKKETKERKVKKVKQV